MRLDDVIKPDQTVAHANGATREALLSAATTVFAERGFQDSTVRDICQLAGANVAAVNYHFGGKEELYGEVVLAVSHTGEPPTHMSLGSDVPAENRLEAHVRWLLKRLVSSGPSDPMGQIMGREMIQPTPALDRLVSEVFRPQSIWLKEVVRDLLGPGFPEATYLRGVMSIVSQIVFYKHCRPVLERMGAGFYPTPEMVEVQIRHIVDFSLAGFHGMRLAREQGGTGRPTSAGEDHN